MRAMTLGIGSALLLMVSAAQTQELPCVNANSTTKFLSRTMTIQLEGRPEISVVGTITSVNASTGEVGLKLQGSGEQVVRPKTIKIVPKPMSMAAQMAVPVSKSLGAMKAKYPLKEVTVEGGIVRYPSCMMPDSGHEIAFAGTLTFLANELAVDGEFFDYSFPRGGGGTPDSDPTRRKPGMPG
jgi:hypothetical protein